MSRTPNSKNKKEDKNNAFENYNPEGRLIDVEYSDIMQKSYIDYAMSVIISRALPDIRDGLKPVQRRILYDMKSLGTYSDKPYRKSARIVGDTMGKFHPHGDSSIYGAMVVLAQDFKMESPLVDGHGNFGSIEGDGAAAMRYTEARLQGFTENAMLADLDKDTVDFQPNFDETEKEPSVLPARFSNFLVNGSEGIAVGMTTSTPTHNFGEVVDATVSLIKNPNLSSRDLLEIVHGPDFPTGGIVSNMDDLPDIYETGVGKIKVRGRVDIESLPGGKSKLIIKEIPYTMIGANIGKFLNDVASLIENRTISGISDISNQSSKEGIRIVIDLKKDTNPEEVLNILYAKTKLEDTFGVNMLAIANGKPEVLGLKSILQHSIDFQYELNSRKYQTLLNQSLKKKEIQEGLIKACDCIDLIIEILRGSKDRKQSKACMVEGITDGIKFKTKKSEQQAAKLKFTEAQADAILDMRLYRLIGLELDMLKKEYEQTLKDIDFCNDVLQNKSSMSKLIIKELTDMKKKYAVPRKTSIENVKTVSVKSISQKEIKQVCLIDKFGYAHTVDEQVYEKNKEAAGESYKYFIPCVSTGKIFILTDDGQSHMIQCRNIPYGKLRDKGIPIDNISTYDSKKANIVGIFSLFGDTYQKLLFCTKHGMVKCVSSKEFDSSKKNISATKLAEGDSVLAVYAIDDSIKTVVLQSAGGYFLRFKTEKIPEMKKTSVGAMGMNLNKTDSIENVYVLKENDDTSVEVSGNKILLKDLRVSGRNTKGSKL